MSQETSSGSGPLASEAAEQRLQDFPLKTFLEQIPAFLWRADATTGQFSFVSKGVQAMLGYAAEDWLKARATWAERIHPDDRAWATEFVLRSAQDRADFDFVHRVVTADGRTVWLRKVVHVIGGEGGAKELVGLDLDVTALKEAQASLVKSLDELAGLRAKLAEPNSYPRERGNIDSGPHRIVGQSHVIQRVLAQAQQVAPTDSTVLLLGETGTGKDLLAMWVHGKSSRRQRPLVTVNCAAIPSALIESELFGRERGAFTGSLSRQVGRFELANDSTLYLDEIGELSPEVQAKLLRVLESKQVERLGNPKPLTVNVRIIAATNRDLEKAVGEGKFRQDLYYRLNVFPIRVPPLRERQEDIPLLVWAFVDEFARTFKKNIESIERESMEALLRYSWPGNIRELRNLVERAMIVATGPRLRIELPAGLSTSAKSDVGKLEEVERNYVLGVLERSGWRIRGPFGAATKLGLKPTTLEARMAKLGIHRPSPPDSQAGQARVWPTNLPLGGAPPASGG